MTTAVNYDRRRIVTAGTLVLTAIDAGR